MKNFHASLFIAGFAILLAAGCTHTLKVKATEDAAQVPYESMGTLEVSVPVNPWDATNWHWSIREVGTLSFADTTYGKRLRKKLAKVASKHAGVNQIVNVEYWPDPSTGKFPDGRIYARGEMVRFKPFPKEPAPVQPAAAAEAV